MKHRGRHRRRRRGQALRATLAGTALALTAAATLISASQATGAHPGALTPLTSASRTRTLRLHENLVAQDTLDTLTRDMGGNVGVAGVLRSADHTLRNRAGCDTAEAAALPVEPTATRAYCWDRSDTATRRWLPRSVTTSGDADGDGKWGANRVVLSGWTHDGARAGGPAQDRGLARIAFIDADDPRHLAYRWVLLVAPRDGGKDFEAVRSRLGGMVWYQDKLIVTAGDGAGLLVFDMKRILRTHVNSGAIGRVSGGYAAHGYQYVLPAIGSYRQTGGPCDSGSDHGVPCFGSLSLDRTSAPDSLVATERSRPAGSGPTRLWRYGYSTAADRTGLLADDSGNRVDASEAFTTKATGLSGALSHTRAGASGADWYVGSSPGAHDRHGTLWRQNRSGAEAATCTADRTYACWGRQTGSLSYWQETGELWTQTQEGVLYAVPLSSVDTSLE